MPNVKVSLIFMLQWDDERFNRSGSMAMFGAFGATDKRLVWHVGAHAEMQEEGRRHARAFLAERLGRSSAAFGLTGSAGRGRPSVSS